jgi:4-hydroxy-tetrahydrodipicolinate reductase
MQELGRKNKWVNHQSNNPEELVIISERTDPAPGTHIVEYRSEIDEITITHTAHSRKGFATGAVIAAEYLNSHRKGVFGMQDVLGIQ